LAELLNERQSDLSEFGPQVAQPSVSSTLFDGYHEIPRAWSDLCPKDNLGMDLDVLGIFQRTLSDQCRCWGLMLNDHQQQLVGCAALCVFPVELMETNSPLVIRFRDFVRRVWPMFLRMNVVFCGLPVPAGSSHLVVKDGADVIAIVDAVEQSMRLLARKHRGRLLIFKEMNSLTDPVAMTLSAKQYVSGGIPPMHLLERGFADFADYMKALKSRYRTQIIRSQKKLEQAGFEVLQGRGYGFFSENFSDQVYSLYVEVQQRAAQKLELMTAAFFREMAQHLDHEVLLTVIRREGQVCAFTFAITRGRTHYNMYSGLDYAMNNEGDLYFNLFYHDLDRAFREGATSMHLGQTSDEFKSRLGTRAESLWFFAKSPSAFINQILHRFAPLIFQKTPAVETNDVFHKPPPSKKSGR
jgi:hypothetical protein